MRCYIIATGITFSLMFVAHIARLLAEGTGLFREPMVIVTTALSLGFAIWALILIRRPR